MNVVGNNMIVSIRYIMKNSRAEILEDNTNGTPVHYLHGSTAILICLQKQLEGLKPQDKKKIFLTKEAGGPEETFSFDVIIDAVRLALKEEIMLGYPVLADENICPDDCDCHQ